MQNLTLHHIHVIEIALRQLQYEDFVLAHDQKLSEEERAKYEKRIEEAEDIRRFFDKKEERIYKSPNFSVRITVKL